MPIHNPNDGSTYVVKYMNLMGRAGIIRVMLHLVGADYTNEFVMMEHVAANKFEFPFGHLPVLLEHRPNGTTFELAEALAIEHYLAEKFGLLGSTAQEAALYKSVAFNIYFELYFYCFAHATPIQEQLADPASEFNTKALPHFLTCHEHWLTKNGKNGHYFGNDLTYPDLVLLNWIRLLEAMGVILDKNSPIKKLEQVVKVMPEWKGRYDAFHPVSAIMPE